MVSNEELQSLMRALEEQVNKTLLNPNERTVPLDKLFPDEFMREHTRYDSIRSFVREASLDPGDGDEHVLTPVLDDLVRGTTDFSSWSEMRQRAELRWMDEHL